jgi:rfaE bifunctional protein nucleotidyltransferase chain/domain
VKIEAGMGRALTHEAALAFVHALHRDGKTVVWTSGVFDLLHPGHVRFLQQARALGDALMVDLEADASVRRRLGAHRPINPDRDRAEVLLALASVDVVVITDEKARSGILGRLKPDVIVESERSLGDGEPAEVPRTAPRVVRISVEPDYSIDALAAKARLT